MRAVADAGCVGSRCGRGHRARSDRRRRGLARCDRRDRGRRGLSRAGVSAGARGAAQGGGGGRARALAPLPAPGVVLDATWVDETRRFVEETELRGCAGTHAAVFRASALRPALLEALALIGTALG